MIEVTSVQPHIIMKKHIEVEFILFGKFKCEAVFKDKGFEDWDEIKIHIENKLTEDFKNASVMQLEGKPSNLKTK